MVVIDMGPTRSPTVRPDYRSLAPHIGPAVTAGWINSPYHPPHELPAFKSLSEEKDDLDEPPDGLTLSTLLLPCI